MNTHKAIRAALTAVLSLAPLMHLCGAENAAAFLKSVEGYRSKAYRDTGGTKTIGYGFTSAAMLGKGQLTRSESSAELVRQCRIIKRQLHRELGSRITLTASEETALVSFIYNVGFDTFRRSSMCRLLKSGKRGAVVGDEFLKWVYVTKGGRKRVCKGLMRRRMRERRLFVMG